MPNVVSCAIVLTFLVAQSAARNEIVGKWIAVEDTDGLHSILEFRPNGICSVTLGVVGSEAYKIEGNRILSVNLEQNNELDAIEFRLDGAKLVLKTEEGKITFTRISTKLSRTGLVGKWGTGGAFFHGGEAGTWIIEFTEDGQLRTVMQREPKTGRYATKGDWLTLRIDGKSRALRYRFADGLLVLDSYSDIGREDRYRRVQW